MSIFLDRLERFLGLKKPPVHKLKWKLPELRFSFPVKDAEQAVAKIRKIFPFRSGGEFSDVVLAKEYGQGVYSYFLIRSDKRTEEETLLFDGYMIQEEEPLGTVLESGYATQESLEKLGFVFVLSRSVTEWRFSSINCRVAVFDVDGFSKFIEFALPRTDVEKTREIQLKAFDLAIKKLGLKQKDAFPTDVVTLQCLSSKAQKLRSKKAGGVEFSLGK